MRRCLDRLERTASARLCRYGCIGPTLKGRKCRRKRLLWVYAAS